MAYDDYSTGRINSKKAVRISMGNCRLLEYMNQATAWNGNENWDDV